MKHTLSLGLMLMLTLAVWAQDNVTQFLGLPVDGRKMDLLWKLRRKGFVYNAEHDELRGQFNGTAALVRVGTHRNRVCRIMVEDAYAMDEGDIVRRFNNLCLQFEQSGRYLPQNLSGGYAIGEEVDLGYAMAVGHKRFEAAYYQLSEADLDTTGLAAWARARIGQQAGGPAWADLDAAARRQAVEALANDYLVERVAHKSVWFMIERRHGRYRILLFYDNELNRAQGEDL